jgi:hypothetical protein
MQTEPPCQCVKTIPHYLLRLLAELPVKVRIIVRVHAALEYFSISRAIREPRCDAQGSDPVASKPSGTNLVCLTAHVVRPAPQMRELPMI